MSGSGSNLRRLLEYQNPAFEVVFLFSDNAASQVRELALDYNLPYFVRDIRRFYAARQKSRRLSAPDGWAWRQRYDEVAGRLIEAFAIEIIALGGYMSVLTLPLGGVNVHPGDLSLQDASGRRLLVGDHAVKDAIMAGHRQLRASTIWIDSGVDSGPLLLLSDPIAVKLSCPLAELNENQLQQAADEHQEQLKQKGDWLIFPLTIQLLAQGRLKVKDNIAWLDDKPYPQGITLDKIG